MLRFLWFRQERSGTGRSFHIKQHVRLLVGLNVPHKKGKWRCSQKEISINYPWKITIIRDRMKLSRATPLLCCTLRQSVAIRFVKASTRCMDTFLRRLISMLSRQSKAMGMSSFDGPGTFHLIFLWNFIFLVEIYLLSIGRESDTDVSRSRVGRC